jgi:OH-DDVA oxygenase/3-O-methylgallate 3,4-dioxygenase
LPARQRRGRSTPNVPVYQNTFFPPNQSTAKRSYRFGQVIKEAIESWPSEKRVAVFASGGMSHFVIDEEFDRKFVGALKAGTRTTSRRFRSRTFSPARRS